MRRANSCFFSQSKARLSRRMKILFFFPCFFCNFFKTISFLEENLSSVVERVLWSQPAFLSFYFYDKSSINTPYKNNLIITNMSAALTSSTFVGAKVSVAKTTTASKRVAFSVQANASGPKKVRIPISFFFCALKNHRLARFRRGGGRPNFAFRPTRK